jgi:hypothetical protein
VLKYQIRNKFLAPILSYAQERWARRQQTQESYNKLRCTWDKIRFIKWITMNVYGKFKLHNFYTFKNTPILEGMAPINIYQLQFINEVHWQLDMDAVYDEPICLHFRDINAAPASGSGYLYRCPASMRELTEEELTCAALSNRQQVTVH